jgi:hypothetical protein
MSEDAGSGSPARRSARRSSTNKVRLVTHPSAEASETGMGKTIFESDDEAAARHYVETNHPRGAEVVLQTADGKVGHYSADLKAQGHEGDGWLDFESED